jgi:hypothetical protein
MINKIFFRVNFNNCSLRFEALMMVKFHICVFWVVLPQEGGSMLL